MVDRCAGTTGGSRESWIALTTVDELIHVHRASKHIAVEVTLNRNSAVGTATTQ